jgi:hypothetical protein
MNLAAVIAFVTEYWAEIVAVLAALHAIAVVIVNATPTETDNKILATLHKVLVIVADVIPNTKTGKTPGE